MTLVHSGQEAVIPTERAASSVAEILNRAADLLEPEGAWTQGQCARGEDETWPNPEDDNATCWCGVGAVMRIAFFRFGEASEPQDTAICSLHALARNIGFDSFAAFNDAPERTQAEVVAALRNAAEQAA